MEINFPLLYDSSKDSRVSWPPGYYIYNYFYLGKITVLVKIFYVSPLIIERVKINRGKKMRLFLSPPNFTPKPYRDKFGENI